MGYRLDENYLLATLTNGGTDHVITRIVTEYAKNWVSPDYDAALAFAKANPNTSAFFFLDISREFDEWTDAYEAWALSRSLTPKPEVPYVQKPWMPVDFDPSPLIQLLIERSKN